MNPALPSIYLVRHGDTAWTLTAMHTGRTDIPLSKQGERQAHELGASLSALRFDRILSSPLRRARRTAEILRILAVRWIGLVPIDGRRLLLATTLSVLGYDHDLTEPASSLVRPPHGRYGRNNWTSRQLASRTPP